MLAKLPIFCGTGRASMRRVCLKVWRNASSYDETVQLKKNSVKRLIQNFSRAEKSKLLASQHGINGEFYPRACGDFKRFLLKGNPTAELRQIVSSLCDDKGNINDLFPHFLEFSRSAYPLVDCLDELKNISDLTIPADWFPATRRISRHIVYHAGPTNSGKTHAALKNFRQAASGIYCGPLRLLAHEIYKRTNAEGVACDLVTGEERQLAHPDGETVSSHLSCTVEMANTQFQYECAVVDEIQMIRDDRRGWAWTKALLGLRAREMHLCGEESAIDIIHKLLEFTDDKIELRKHERLTPLTRLNTSLRGDFRRLEPGDCVVAFSRKDIFKLRRRVEKTTGGQRCAVIYGGLPPATRAEQAQLFNDNSSGCNFLVASDAIGMGLNLNIKRIIFSTLTKFDGSDVTLLTPSQAKQIAGRAGRFGSQYPDGGVTTLYEKDFGTLQKLLKAQIEPVKLAGIAPTFEQLELFGHYLPKATLKELIKLFEELASLDGNYFLCNVEDQKAVAELVERLPLNMKDKYIFCLAPVDTKKTLVTASLYKMAKMMSRFASVSAQDVREMIRWPIASPRTSEELQTVESAHEVIDVYLWLSQRFPEVFAAVVDVREMQTVLESVISRTIAENSTLKPRQTKLEEKREEANSFAMLRLVSESSNSTESSAFEKKLAQRYGIRRKDLEMLKRLWIKSVVKKFKRG
ncbi:ATP-dependent RNA helicase SUPV3L1, mitochondrial-like [Oscarella lobularis]|uniref:ATP-dependent RNA helicase SUPV3L1, mitochondrial-like n=1 Tax=Oscarella lobularis TaxID=121494 RepID=UPI00331373BA